VRTRIVLALLAALLLCVGIGANASAQSILQQLVSPGELSSAHQKFEGQCEKCHDSFFRGSQASLCLDCHKDIAADRKNLTDYHGRSIEARTRDCRGCHTEHKGRDADLTGVDHDRFDHGLTNYPLLGAHAKVECSGCHAPKRQKRNAETRCVGCHAKVEPHKGQLGDRCDDCHSTKNWREIAQFDHAKTNFPLVGAHKDVACLTCHAAEKYKDLPKACVSCHLIQDVHAQRYGDKCEACHGPTKWKDVTFDHQKTKFPLHGAHSAVKCDACHVGDLFTQKLSVECVACHGKIDPHAGALGAKCEKCHSDADWRRDIKFNHNESKFPLQGAHATAICESCHATKRYVEAPIACAACHQDTFHQGRLGAVAQCGECHDPVAWKNWRFDHARQTRFPLAGAHGALVCEKCHVTPNPASLKLPMACVSCHKDYHQGALGASPRCETCHNSVAWPQWRFNHAEQAHYPLVGAHLALACEKCHVARGAPSLKIASECVACHRGVNPHGVAFGLACQRCHDPIGWRHLTIRQ